MKDAGAPAFYDLALQSRQAVVCEPGTLFQLRNDRDEVAEVLYIVSPSYVFEIDSGRVVHDDAVLVAKSWDELVASNYDVPELRVSAYEASATRAEAKGRLAARKGHHPSPLNTEAIVSLKQNKDYLAPDGSEIRLLVTGENGGFAHCLLPAGKVSAPVRHRTVEELWYVLEGAGEIWRASGDQERVDRVRSGDSIRISVGTSFQFHAAEDSSLTLLIATMPPWPGAEEAVPTTGKDMVQQSD